METSDEADIWGERWKICWILMERQEEKLI